MEMKDEIANRLGQWIEACYGERTVYTMRCIRLEGKTEVEANVEGVKKTFVVYDDGRASLFVRGMEGKDYETAISLPPYDETFAPYRDAVWSEGVRCC